ncbi:hypothetical protein K438DRAFT_1991810 [Mycena galopus ATCC 62051]|nr:hypothetical protein K438DRAFT_1991810 [Mycena galopus ATCC 62051]
MPLPHTLLAALHTCCPICTTTHCCRCGMATTCKGDWDASPSHPRSYSASAPLRMPTSSSTALGRDTPTPSTSSPALGYNTTYTPPPCAVLTHFPAACTLGTLAALLAFERAAVVQNQGSPGRATDKALLGSIYAVVWCIEGPSYLWWSHHESQARSVYGGSSYRGSNNMMRSCKKHPTLLLLIALSYLPGYVVTLLQAGLCSWVDIGTWMARALVYGTVLRVLRAGVAECLQGPYQTAMEQKETEKPSCPSSATLSPCTDWVFGPMVETAHALCDGMIYLLLQGMHQKDQETE